MKQYKIIFFDPDTARAKIHSTINMIRGASFVPSLFHFETGYSNPSEKTICFKTDCDNFITGLAGTIEPRDILLELGPNNYTLQIENSFGEIKHTLFSSSGNYCSLAHAQENTHFLNCEEIPTAVHNWLKERK